MAGQLLGTPEGAVLDRVRVLELTRTIGGAYTAKLFADAGAEVIKVEPPGGDRLRSWSASGSPAGGDSGDGAFFQFLNAGKRSTVVDLDDPVGRERFRSSAATADLVIEDWGAGVVESMGLGHAELAEANQSLVMLSISPWGRGGPWDQRPANEFTLQSWVGSTHSRGIPDEMPLGVGGQLGDFLVAANAGALGLAALMAARRDGTPGEHVDVSAYEAMTTSFVVYAHLYAAYASEARTGATRSIEIPSVEPAKDGWVGFCTITGQQFKDFCVVIDDPEMAEDQRLSSGDGRMDHRDEVWRRIARFTQAHTVDDIVDKATMLRVPVAPIGDGSRVAQIDHFAERGVYVENPGGFTQPRVPYQLTARPAARCRPRPPWEKPTMNCEGRMAIRFESRAQCRRAPSRRCRWPGSGCATWPRSGPVRWHRACSRHWVPTSSRWSPFSAPTGCASPAGSHATTCGSGARSPTGPTPASAR